MLPCVQLAKRSAPDHFTTEDEYRDWSDEDEPANSANDAQQVKTANRRFTHMIDPAETFPHCLCRQHSFPKSLLLFNKQSQPLEVLLYPS